MSTLTKPFFEMHPLAESEWLILDNRFDPADARHTVAYVSQLPGKDVDVVWLRMGNEQRKYASAEDVLEAVCRVLPPSPTAEQASST